MVELGVLPWPAVIVNAEGHLRECNALWKARFGSCEALEIDFPEAASKLRDVAASAPNANATNANATNANATNANATNANATNANATNANATNAVFLVRAPGEIAPLRLRFAQLREANDGQPLWLIIVEERADEQEEPIALSDTPELRDVELRDVELAMDGVAMRLQARNWRAFFHEAAAGKALIGLHGETLEVNRSLCRLIGRSESELLNLYVRDLRHPDDCGIVEQHYRSVLDGGPPVAGIEARYLHRDGHYLTCLLSLSLIRDSRGKPLYFATEVEDITSRRQAEGRLREQAHQLERANFELIRSNTDLERFAFVASHDLQEPLRKIRVFGDRLQRLTTEARSNDGTNDGTVGTDVARYANVMIRAAERMQNLVDDLLSYGRLKNQDAPFVPVDLNEVWADLREEFETTLRESGGQLQVGELPIVRGNAFRLRQLFGNLLSNALKFRGEEPPHIEVRVVVAGETGGIPANIAVEIKDNGIGFDQSYAEAIFEIFVRLHGRSRYPGTGIGLAICRRVAREHGGDIRAFATNNEGARFIVTLAL